ncbi:hypothetical protein Sango_0168700, partial [Sesamum angolense]
MSSGDSSANGHKNVENQAQSLDFASRLNLGATSAPKNVKGKENLINSEDQETMELYSRASTQEKEISYLREQIALASIRESQLLNEKYALERKFAELRVALDEKQSEVITSASNELARRKGDLEENWGNEASLYCRIPRSQISQIGLVHAKSEFQAFTVKDTLKSSTEKHLIIGYQLRRSK